jgi:MoxR-like ATPase
MRQMDEGIQSRISDIERVKAVGDRFRDNVHSVVVGKEDAVKLLFVALLCEGHVLIEDVPGVGKTLLAKTAAQSLGCRFQRIQCTPDLLPSDVLGIQYFNQKTQEFEFRPGPVMANMILVDEINRAMPRTQSCLLECMQEHQVTLDLDTIALARPFMVIATQNPVELEGTFPLPEAQLDRFMLRLTLGYPSGLEEQAILERFGFAGPFDGLKRVIEVEELFDLQRACGLVFVEPSVRRYLIDVTTATRSHSDIRLGASPRASLALYSGSQALAALEGRNFVVPDDIKFLADPVLAHRLLLTTEARLRGRTASDIIQEIVSTVAVPVED